MRLRQLETFRRTVFCAGSAPSVSSLRRSIDRGTLAGGIIKDGVYYVDVEAFERDLYPDREPTPPPKLNRRPRVKRSMTPVERREVDAHYGPIELERELALKRSAAHSRKRKRLIRQATPAWADLDAIAAIYELARLRTNQTGIPHCVDHEIPLQGKFVCGLHVETNLRVITIRQNSSKHNHYAG